jgi:methylated-DNA-protein-cysteine methyltransferase-like protein
MPVARRPHNGSVASELTVECVLTCVEQVPPGRVVSYGDVAAIVGTSARRVGAVMSRQGAAVAWWRVVNAAGSLPTPLLVSARAHWREEGIAETPTGCAIRRHRADLPALAEAYDRAIAPVLRREDAGYPRDMS